jgi:hypothetical protein
MNPEISQRIRTAVRWFAPHPLAYLIAAILVIPMAILPVMGYGRYVSFFAFPLMLFYGSGCVVIFLAKELRASRAPATAIFIAAAFLGSWLLGWEIRLFQCRAIQRRIAPVIRALNERKAATGEYPTTLAEIPEARALGGSIRQGKFLKNAVSTDGITTAEATFYLASDKYACLIAIEKPLPVSITGFHIYRYLSDAPHWEKDYMIWTVGLL